MNTDNWLKIFNPNKNSKLRLFCFPYAGGGALTFQKWHTQLPQQVEICAIQLPGRENRLRETPFNQLKPLMGELIEIILPYLDKPFAVFGHSMGAIIAFEMARQIRLKYNISPAHLFVSARGAPSVTIKRNPPFHCLSDSEFVKCIQNLDGTPKEVLNNPELLELLLPIMRADFEINETYLYTTEKPLDCPITAFRGTQDTMISYEDTAAWETETNGSFMLRSLPGGHFFIQNELFLQILSHDLSLYI